MTSGRQFGTHVDIEINGEIALVRFDRGIHRNAIDQETLLGLTETARWLSDQSYVHAVVLTGARDIFSAGIDLKDKAKWNDDEGALLDRREIAFRGARLCQLWEELPQITIAAIEGMAVGGAVALALACDWRVGGQGCHFYLPEAKVGLNMGWGAIPRMNTLIGPARTKRAILLAEKMDGEAVLNWGLIDELAPRGQALEAAEALASRLLQVPGALIRMTKEAVNLNANALHRLGSFMDADQALVCRDSQEGRAARARFLGTGQSSGAA